MIGAADVELTRSLERCELPNEGFHHALHLRVAWVYLGESTNVDEARGRMAATLRRFAASAGRSDKYSDAITTFWMYQLAAARAMLPEAGVDEILRAYPRLLDKNLVLAYYSDDAPASRATDSPGDPPDRPLPRRSP
jgi:hypothetical protein